MTSADDRSARLQTARSSFNRLMRYVLGAALLMEVALIAYLAVSDALTRTAVIAGSIGVIVSVVLGAGLMALAFFSSNSGVDDDAGRGAGRAPDEE
ncbi:hypothetical protein KCG44_14115 [Pacificimonas sp. WHA3]|uniref:Uncharacterized protein n=1 Tax=Pacificimonas pallii TaxID=2827236 RepID=A0ABS6SHM3_9SPHN|nr:hypothetical protein [Pacificimonas pallii]MBV7257917.1 hypothetical protein [Pacificimonas pallii]